MDPNFWRGLIFTQAFLVFLMTLAIVIRYSMSLMLTERKDRALPFHVMAVSASYLLATIYIVLEIRARWDIPLTYRTPLAGVIFILGDVALVFMLIHITVQRKFMGQIRAHVTAEAVIEKAELAEELKHQTSGLAQMIKAVGEKADSAYNAANNTNEKIASLRGDAASAAQLLATDHNAQIDEINQTGKDTNKRVRRIEPAVTKENP